MRLLVLGGSWLLGRLVVADALARGFDVTVFNEGRSGVPLSAGARHIRGNRKLDGDLRSLARSGRRCRRRSSTHATVGPAAPTYREFL